VEYDDAAADNDDSAKAKAAKDAAIDAALAEYFASWLRDNDDEIPEDPAPVLDDPSMSTETLRSLLSSNLVKLSSAETARIRTTRSKYPLFKEITPEDEMYRFSYLCDEIPFLLEPANRRLLVGSWDVYYHDEVIDGNAFGKSAARSSLRPNMEGKITIAPEQDRMIRLEGVLYHVPSDIGDQVDGYSDDNEDYEGYYSGGTDETGSEVDDYSDDGNDYESHYSGRADENGGGDENRSGSVANDHDNHEDSINSDEESEEDNWEVDEEEEEWDNQSDSSVRSIFFHFDERLFVMDQSDHCASWRRSGSELNFGLAHHPCSRDEEDDPRGNREDSVTLFRVNEPMAFARGQKQQFISLKDPANYGTESGSYHIHYASMPDEDERYQKKVVEKMRAYRGSWISKLCQGGVELPDSVAHLIAEYWQTKAPPPYLFVEEGDLLLLGRYQERIPDPDFPDMISTFILREHIVLARRCKDED
ncbi:hypothetical protein ACHAWF_002103, partial [Thalassiosira exigua]